MNKLKSKKVLISLAVITMLIIIAIVAVFLLSRKRNTVISTIPQNTVISTPVSASVANTNNSITFPSFPPITKEDLTWGNDEYFTTIQNFYTALSQKDYSTAFKLGSQGRTEEQIKQIYVNTDDIRYFKIIKINQENYDVNVYLRSGTSLYFYKVNLSMSKDTSGKAYISSSNIKKEFTRIFPDCNNDTIDFVGNTTTRCTIRDWNTGELFKVATYSITPWPFLVKGKSLDSNRDYYIAHSGEFGDYMSVFLYNRSNNTLEYVEDLSKPSPFFADGTQLTEDCKLDSLQDYLQSCVNSYSDRKWYKDGVYYLQNKDKYEV